MKSTFLALTALLGLLTLMIGCPESPQPCDCITNEAPVCGSNEVTYNNDCRAECAGVTDYSDGPCQEDCQCIAVYEPVCGSNGLTYSNSCHAACVGITTYSDGACDGD
jgi:hypothetical protein